MVIPPALAYLFIWLGAHGQITGIHTRHDISYGVYIYAFPAQQLLSVFGVNRHGVGLYLACSLVVALALGGASRIVIETPADKLKRHHDQSPVSAGTAVADGAVAVDA